MYPKLPIETQSESAQNIMNLIPGWGKNTQICGNVIKVIRRRLCLSEKGRGAGSTFGGYTGRGRPKRLPPWRGKRQVAGAQPGPTSATSFIINLPVTQRIPQPPGLEKKFTTAACKGLWWVACVILGCAVKKLLCLLILPMRALPSFIRPSLFGGKLHNRKEGKQFLMFGFWQRQVGVAVCVCLCVCVCECVA